jgi:Xaa-Pro aminopeptidase
MSTDDGHSRPGPAVATAGASAAAARRARNVRWLTPAAELERRWQLVRAGMEREGVDVLLAHNHVDGLGGYVKYLCDMGTGGGYPLTVILPRERPMTLVAHGPQADDRRLSPGEDPLLYGVERVLGSWSFSSAFYTAQDDATQIVRALRALAPARVGLVGYAQMGFGLLDHVRRELASVEFVDAADLVDEVKAVKSDWEREAIGRSVRMQVAVFEAALDAIAPGRTEWDVALAATLEARRQGSEHGPIMVGSAPPGAPAMFKPPRHQARVLEPGDRLTMLIEPSGPDGMYAELGRTIVIGSADDALLADHALAVEAWRAAAADLRPGADAAGLAARYNAWLRDHDRPEERRVHSHGQGYDIVERPLVRADENMRLSDGMLMALHPLWFHDGTAIWVCDNVFIGPDGATEPLHGVEQKVFEV